MESTMGDADSDGCTDVETRIYLVNRNGGRILSSVSHDRFCPQAEPVTDIEIGYCNDGYFQGVYITNYVSDDVDCITEYLQDEEFYNAYVVRINEIKSQLNF